jgi:ubiquinone biosynthesis protein
MSEQMGWRGWLRTFREEAPYIGTVLPQLPRLAHRALRADRLDKLEAGMAVLLSRQQGRNRWLAVIALLLALLVASQAG